MPPSEPRFQYFIVPSEWIVACAFMSAATAFWFVLNKCFSWLKVVFMLKCTDKIFVSELAHRQVCMIQFPKFSTLTLTYILGVESNKNPVSNEHFLGFKCKMLKMDLKLGDCIKLPRCRAYWIHLQGTLQNFHKTWWKATVVLFVAQKLLEVEPQQREKDSKKVDRYSCSPRRWTGTTVVAGNYCCNILG